MASIRVASYSGRNEAEYKVMTDIMVRISKVIKGAGFQRKVEAAVSTHNTRRPTLYLQINLLTGGCPVRSRPVDTEVYDVAKTREGNIKPRGRSNSGD